MASQETLTRFIDSGTNQSGLRDQNVRVVLSLIRRLGAVSSAEIARETGLSAQTVSNIIRALEAEKLLSRGKAIKGKVGKPSVPMALNSAGVMSLGLTIGRRSAELVLVDFKGKIVASHSTAYRFPLWDDVFDFLKKALAQIDASHPNARNRIAGIGVARPNKIWNWLEIVGAPEEAMQHWKNLDFSEAVRNETGFEVVIQNDATSACIAEHLLGHGNRFGNFAYIYVGAFVGGGLVLDQKVHSGTTLNTAALGPLPVPDEKGGVTQLLNVASLYVLEDALAASGVEPIRLRTATSDWSEFEDWVAPWIEQTSKYLAIAAISIASVVEVEAILMDGAMPESVRRRVVEGTRRRLSDMDLTGIERPVIEEASVGRAARSVGAALLPIHAKYFLG